MLPLIVAMSGKGLLAAPEVDDLALRGGHPLDLVAQLGRETWKRG